MTTYEVTGSTAYRGHAPGETFDADLDDAAERRALERGSIRVVRKRKAQPDEQEESDDE
jgi:hypothetical protein